jgi:hypothetical protein
MPTAVVGGSLIAMTGLNTDSDACDLSKERAGGITARRKTADVLL